MLMYEDLTVIAVLCRHSYPHLSLINVIQECHLILDYFEFSPKEIE